jgi:hypothetical protein
MSYVRLHSCVGKNVENIARSESRRCGIDHPIGGDGRPSARADLSSMAIAFTGILPADWLSNRRRPIDESIIAGDGSEANNNESDRECER